MDRSEKNIIVLNYCFYVVVGVWIFFLYLFFLTSVIYSLGTFQLKLEVEELILEKLHNEQFVMHDCDISILRTADIDINEMKVNVVEIPCLNNLKNNEQTFKTSQFLKNNTLIDNISKLNEELDLVNSQLEKKNKKIVKAEVDKETQDVIKTLKMEKGNLDGKKSKIESKLNELSIYYEVGSRYNATNASLNFFEKFISSITHQNGVNNLWSIPEVYLSMMLVLSMGGLGSLITVTIDYLKIKRTPNKKIHIVNYIFRPMLGTIIALAVYIAIKSGYMSISEGDIANELPPFLLSFIGIIAGIMSERVYIKLINYGSKVI